jgi:cellulose biosynthesis protein BcsQ
MNAPPKHEEFHMQPPTIVNMDGWVNVADLAPGVILYRKIDAEEARWIEHVMRGTRVVSVIDVKGGVKKTTAAVHIALGLNRYDGGSVLIGDCDQYHSVEDWKTESEREDEATGKVADLWSPDVSVLSASGDNFHYEIAAEVERTQPKYLVFDTPPNDEEAALRALLGADVMVTPTGPFKMDIRRIAYGLKAAMQASDLRDRPISPLVLLTGTRMNTSIYKEARQELRAAGLPFVPMPVRDLVAHAQAFGTSVPDLNDYDYVPETLVPMLDKIHEEKNR